MLSKEMKRVLDSGEEISPEQMKEWIRRVDLIETTAAWYRFTLKNILSSLKIVKVDFEVDLTEHLKVDQGFFERVDGKFHEAWGEDEDEPVGVKENP